MESKEFEILLKKSGLTKMDFSKTTGLNRVTVSAWRSGDKGKNKPPEWTRSWLKMYIKVQECDKLMSALDAVKDADSDYKVEK